MLSPGRRKQEEESEVKNFNWQNAGHLSMAEASQRPHSTQPPSSHHRTLTENLQRPSTIALRGRSHTSTEDYPPTLRKPLRLQESERRSIDRKSGTMSLHQRNDRAGSFSKSLKKKASKLLRRPDSIHDDENDNLTSLRTVDWSSELDDVPFQPQEKTQPHKSMPAQRDSRPKDDPAMRYQISNPFNFHHLTNTEDHDFENMADVSPEEFLSEIGVARSTQPVRRQGKGVRALDLSKHDLSSPEIGQSQFPSRPSTPKRALGETDLQARNSLYHPVSPVVPEFNRDTRSPTAARSSPNSWTSHVSPEVSPTQATFNAGVRRPSTADSDTNTDPSTAPEYDFVVPHAVTTPDNAAHVLSPPPFEMLRTNLSRVIEEDEISEGRRCSISTIIRRPSNSDSSVRHVKSFPSGQPCPGSHSRSNSGDAYRESIQSSPKKQRRSVKIIQPSFDDAEGDVPFQQPRPYSATVKDSEGNWEGLIDWCYDHQAEADCNFDFSRAVSPPPQDATPAATDPTTRQLERVSDFFEDSDESLSPPPTDRTTQQLLASADFFEDSDKSLSPPPPEVTTDKASNDLTHMLMHSSAFFKGQEKRSSSIYSASPPLLPQLRTATSVPDLQPPSAISNHSSFEASEAVTPDVGYDLPPRFPLFNSNPKPNFSKPHSYSPHVSTDTTTTEFYEDLCGEKYARESWHYGRPEGSTISSISARSSQSPISKSSSQESFNLSRRHRSNNSQASLPELISSRSSREKVEHFPEQLAENLNTMTVDDNTLRRRSPTRLVRDVAQKNLLAKLQEGTVEDACSAQTPLPLHPALRDSAPISPIRYSFTRCVNGDEALMRHSGPCILPVPRKRSQSSATGLKSSLKKPSVNISPRASRASYGLYPVSEKDWVNEKPVAL